MQKIFLNKKRNQYLAQNFPENLLPTKKLSKKNRSSLLNTRRNFQNRIRNHLKNLRKLVIKDLKIKEKTDFLSCSSADKSRFVTLALVDAVRAKGNAGKSYNLNSFISKQKTVLNYGKKLYSFNSLILFKTFYNLKSLYKLSFPSEKIEIKDLQGKKLQTGIYLSSTLTQSLEKNMPALKSEICRTNKSMICSSQQREERGNEKAFLWKRENTEKPKFRKFRYSLEQLLAEFYKRNSQQKQRKLSFFKELLIERKKLSLIYGNLSIKEIKKSVEKSKALVGNFSENLIKILESRLDVVLYRISFFPTIFAARQSINHGQILVNNKKIIFSGYQLKPGDIIKVNRNSKKILKKAVLKFLKEKIKGRSLPFLLDNNLIRKLFSKKKPSFSLSSLCSDEQIIDFRVNAGKSDEQIIDLLVNAGKSPTKEENERGIKEKSLIYQNRVLIPKKQSLEKIIEKESRQRREMVLFSYKPELWSFLELPSKKQIYRKGYPLFQRCKTDKIIKDLHSLETHTNQRFVKNGIKNPTFLFDQRSNTPLEVWSLTFDRPFFFEINKLGFHFMKYLQSFLKIENKDSAFALTNKSLICKARVKFEKGLIIETKEKTDISKKSKLDNYQNFKKPYHFYINTLEKRNIVRKKWLKMEKWINEKNSFSVLSLPGQKPAFSWQANQAEKSKIFVSQKEKMENFYEKPESNVSWAGKSSLKSFKNRSKIYQKQNSSYSASKVRNKSLISFLKLRKKFTSKVSSFLRLVPFRISSQKPLHLEISYKGLFAIFLYSPQRVLFPAHINFPNVKKSFR